MLECSFILLRFKGCQKFFIPIIYLTSFNEHPWSGNEIQSLNREDLETKLFSELLVKIWSLISLKIQMNTHHSESFKQLQSLFIWSPTQDCIKTLYNSPANKWAYRSSCSNNGGESSDSQGICSIIQTSWRARKILLKPNKSVSFYCQGHIAQLSPLFHRPAFKCGMIMAVTITCWPLTVCQAPCWTV